MGCVVTIQLDVRDATVGHRVVSRVFLPFTHFGCGIGCTYCYIDHPSAPAEYLSDHEIGEHVASIPRQSDAIACLASDTDPFVTERSTAIAETYLRACEAAGVCVQIATKCVLPTSIRDILDSWVGNKPIVFTTITSVRLASRMEPGAPSAQLRATNFRRQSDRWRSVALVKPLLSLSDSDRCDLIDLILSVPPDAAVFGSRFRRRRYGPHSSEHMFLHPCKKGWVGSAPQPHELAATVRLRDAGVPVFMNTECVVDYFNHNGAGIHIRETFAELCTSCGVCGGL